MSVMLLVSPLILTMLFIPDRSGSLCVIACQHQAHKKVKYHYIFFMRQQCRAGGGHTRAQFEVVGAAALTTQCVVTLVPPGGNSL